MLCVQEALPGNAGWHELVPYKIASQLVLYQYPVYSNSL